MSINPDAISQRSEQCLTQRTVNLSNAQRIASVVSGGALTAYGLTRRSPLGVAMAALGGALVYTGATGHCAWYGAKEASDAGKDEVPREVHLQKSIIINRSPSELYHFWQNVEYLPKFSKYLCSVTPIDQKRSHWILCGPAGVNIEWDAEIFNQKENELIAWRSLSCSDIANAGSVHFYPIAKGNSTLLRVVLNYNPPAGKLGARLAELLGMDPAELIREDLQRLKKLLEGGELAVADGEAFDTSLSSRAASPA